MEMGRSRRGWLPAQQAQVDLETAAPSLLDSRMHAHKLLDMAKTIQIRNVPEAVHKRLRQRATDAGMSLSTHVLVEITRLAALPTRKEWLARLHAATPVELSTSAAELVRRERGPTRSKRERPGDAVRQRAVRR